MMKNSIAKTVLIGSSITGGFVAGMLFSKGLSLDYFDKNKHFVGSLREKSKQLNNKRDELKKSLFTFYDKNLADPLPDLYKATEGLSLSENELLNE